MIRFVKAYFLNSFLGKKWGERGYFRMIRGTNLYGIEDFDAALRPIIANEIETTTTKITTTTLLRFKDELL